MYDNKLDKWFVPDPGMKRGYGFLFMVRALASFPCMVPAPLQRVCDWQAVLAHSLYHACTVLCRALLHQTYEPTAWWWEVKELWKKARLPALILPVCVIVRAFCVSDISTPLAQFFFCAVLIWMGPGGGATSPDQLTLGFLVGTLELVGCMPLTFTVQRAWLLGLPKHRFPCASFSWGADFCSFRSAPVASTE